MTMYIGNIYLNITLDQYENMRINISYIPQELIDEYKVYDLNYVHNGFMFVEIQKSLFGLK